MELSRGKEFSEVYQAGTLIVNHTLVYVGPMALKCAVELGIADVIESHARPVSLSELARSIPIPPEKDQMLRRLMRLLVARGVFSVESHRGGEGEHEPVYSLTPFSRLLVRKGANMSAYVLGTMNQALLHPLFLSSTWFRTKDAPTPFEMSNGGMCFWEFMNEHPEVSDLFNGAMASNTLWMMKVLVSEHPSIFRGLKTLVDVGGGTGAASRMIAEAFPGLKCTVFDLPHVLDTMLEGKAAVEAIGGDMFEYIPPANAAFLKNILHNWGDEDCVKILKWCKEAIPRREEGGKVIIVDAVVNSRPENQTVTETQLFYDMTMMLAFEGMEREEHEWKKLFDDAGFEGYKISPLPGVNSVIELYP